MAFTVTDKSVDSEIARIQSILHNMGIKSASKSDVIRFLLSTKQHSDKIREAILRNTKRI